MEPEGEAKLLRTAQGVVEPLLVLGVAFLVVLVLSSLFLPENLSPAAGGEPEGARASERPDFEALVRDEPQLVPWFLALQAAVFLLAGALMIRWRVESRPTWPRWGAPRAVLLGLGGGVAAVVLSGMLGVLLQLAGWPVEEQAWIVELLGQPGQIWAVAPWIVIVAPVAEEVFFRGYMFRFMEQRIGYPAGLLLSSLVFAAIHLNPPGLPVYVLIAAVMAWVYRRSGNLATPIVAHAVLNGTVLLASAFFPQSATIIL